MYDGSLGMLVDGCVKNTGSASILTIDYCGIALSERWVVAHEEFLRKVDRQTVKNVIRRQPKVENILRTFWSQRHGM